MGTDRMVLIIYGVIIFILTAAVAWIVSVVMRLTKDVGKGNVVSLLEALIKKEDLNSKNIVQVFTEIKAIQNAIKPHLQKVGLVRFNPFEELGGNHSFSLALLDKNSDGFIITGLHGRDKTRVYIKEIKNGRSELKLSKEEDKALKIASR